MLHPELVCLWFPSGTRCTEQWEVRRAGRNGITDPWGARTPYGPGEQWPVRVDNHLAAGVGVEDVERWVPTAAVLHSNGDGMELAVRTGRIVGVRGRADDAVNRGRLDP